MRSTPSQPSGGRSASSDRVDKPQIRWADRLSLTGEIEVAREIQLAMLPTGTYTAADAEICRHSPGSRFTDDLTVLVLKRAAFAPDASAPRA